MRMRQLGALIQLSLLDLYRRKDLFVLFVLSLVLLVPLTMVKPFGIGGANRYMNEFAMLLVWIFSIVVSLGVSARLFPPEFESRTIYPLLAKPIDCGVLLFGKYLGAWVAALSALALFYCLYAVMSGLRQDVWFPPILFQAFLLHAGFVTMLTAISLMGSLVVTSAANIALCAIVSAVMLLFGQRLPAFAESASGLGKAAIWLCYAVGPHFEFFDMRQRLVHDWSMVGWGVCALTLLYAGVYSTAALFVAAFALKRKRL